MQLASQVANIQVTVRLLLSNGVQGGGRRLVVLAILACQVDGMNFMKGVQEYRWFPPRAILGVGDAWFWC